MSQFITPLDTRKLALGPHGRLIFKLLAPLVYQSDLLGKTITVPFGFVTDFATVPRLPLVFLATGDRAHEAAVIHDWLYSVHVIDGMEIERSLADDVFREAVEVVEKSATLARVMWLGVRVGGSFAWEAPNRVQPEHVRRVIDEMQREAA